MVKTCVLYILLLAVLAGVAAAGEIEDAVKRAKRELGQQPVGALLDRIDASAKRALDEAGGTFNAALFNAASTMQGMVAQLREQLKGDLDKLLANVSDQRVLAIYDLHVTVQRVRENLLDDFAQAQVGATRMINQLRFIAEDLPFLIVRIKPGVLSKEIGVAEYPLTIYGVGFGIDDGRRRYSASFILGGKPLAQHLADRQTHGITFLLSDAALAPFWSAGKIVRVPARLESTVRQRCLRRLWLADCVDTYGADFTVTLYPTDPAKLRVRQFEAFETFEGQPHTTIEYPLTTPNRHGQRDATPFVGKPEPAPPGTRWRTGALNPHKSTSHVGESCRFWDVAPSCRISADATIIQCQISGNSHPCTRYFNVTYATPGMRERPLPDTPLYEVRRGNPTEVVFSRRATRAVLEGVLPTGKAVRVDLVPNTVSATEPVICVGKVESGENAIVKCRLAPAW